MLKFTLLTTTLLLFLGCNQSRTINVREKEPQNITSQNIVNVPIHISDNGYRHFSTKIFNTQDELNDFLHTINGQKGWNKKKNFLYTMKKQEIDFKKDTLLIYRFSEPVNSIVIATKVPTEIKREITVKVGKKKTSSTTNSDMAYYGLAYIINKNTKSVIFDDGEKKKSIDITKH